MKTKLTPFLLFTCFLSAMISCKKPDALNKETSKNLLKTASTTPVRYRDSVFANVETTSFFNIFYRRAQNFDITEDLSLDVYMPAGDTEINRACTIYMHGGGFIRTKSIQRKSIIIMKTCLNYARRSYVVVSISYRTGVDYQSGQTVSQSVQKLYDAFYKGA